jgi:CBS domain-containing protein
LAVHVPVGLLHALIDPAACTSRGIEGGGCDHDNRVENRGRVATIDENKFVLDAAKLMTEAFIGSVIVTNSFGIRGLFTERELAMNVVGKGKAPEKVQIKDVMTSDPIKVSPSATASMCLDLMKEHRCRHLLVFEGDEFVGIVSLRDMVALMIDEKEELIGHLERYITS